MRGVPGEAVGPRSRWLLENQSAAQPRIVVSVRHRVVGPRTVFCPKQPARVVSKLRRARRVNHVGESLQRVVLQGDVRAGRIIDEGQVAHIVVRVSGVAFGLAPTIRQAAVGVVGVAQDFDACLVEFVRNAAVLVVVPRRHLVLAVGERLEVVGGVVGEAVGVHAHAHFVGLARRGVVSVGPHLAQLICVAGQGGDVGRVAKGFPTPIGIRACRKTIQHIVGVGYADAIGTGLDPLNRH